MLNVLFLNSWYPNKIHPTNGDFIQNHAKAVSAFCNVICLQVQGIENQEELFLVEKKRNAKVLEIIVYYKKESGTSVLNSLRNKKKQKKAFIIGYTDLIFDFPKIDIVHLNVIFPAGFFALYLKKKYQIPFIISEHNTTYLDINFAKIPFIELLFIKRIAKQASYICPVSTLLEKSMKNRNIIGNYLVIPNVVNAEEFNYKPKKITDKIHILHISTLENKHKNYQGMLHVIKKLSLCRNDFVFTVLSNSNLNLVQQYAKDIDLSNLFFKTKQGKCREDVISAMQQTNLFMLFSNYETFSLVVAEALYCGTPVISTNVGIVGDLITEKNGVLVQVGDEEELLFKLNETLNCIASYDNKAISENVIGLFNYQKVGELFSTLYSKVLNEAI